MDGGFPSKQREEMKLQTREIWHAKENRQGRNDLCGTQQWVRVTEAKAEGGNIRGSTALAQAPLISPGDCGINLLFIFLLSKSLSIVICMLQLEGSFKSGCVILLHEILSGLLLLAE